MSEIILDFDPQVTQVLKQYHQLKELIRQMSEDDDMPDDQKAFYLENVLGEFQHIKACLTQAFKERTGG